MLLHKVRDICDVTRIMSIKAFMKEDNMDNSQFAEAAERYMDTIYRIAYSWLRNADDANDITQDVLMKLYRTENSFQSEEHLRNWLIRVTVNACKSFFRAPWHKEDDIEKYAESLHFEQPDYRELFEAVMKLDRKYRIPLMLFYFDGYSTREIAGLLGISENTVSTRLSRARAKLKMYLEEV